MTKRRELTQQELDAATRLQQIWNAKKKELGLTQEKVAQLCEWSNQSAFGAYLLARVPLNTDAVLRLAKVFKIHPTEIMPELAVLLPTTTIENTTESDVFTAEEKTFIKMLRRVTSEQKKDTIETIKEFIRNNQVVIEELTQRNMNRQVA
ncbi:MAG: helix-turn-helix transcriptional regulator [Methylococcales bacterium]|nr:helix-turn-helix transcriptional regulator [Methylococcales bacterium]